MQWCGSDDHESAETAALGTVRQDPMAQEQQCLRPEMTAAFVGCLCKKIRGETRKPLSKPADAKSACGMFRSK